MSHPSQCENSYISKACKPFQGILETLNSCSGAKSCSIMAPDLKAERSGGLWAVNFYCSFENLVFSPFANFTNSTKSWAVKRQEARKFFSWTVFPLDLNVTEVFLSFPHAQCFSFHKLIKRFTLICLALYTGAPLVALTLELINTI